MRWRRTTSSATGCSWGSAARSTASTCRSSSARWVAPGSCVAARVTVFLTGATLRNGKVIQDCFRFAQVLYQLGRIANLAGPQRLAWRRWRASRWRSRPTASTTSCSTPRSSPCPRRQQAEVRRGIVLPLLRRRQRRSGRPVRRLAVEQAALPRPRFPARGPGELPGGRADRRRAALFRTGDRPRGGGSMERARSDDRAWVPELELPDAPAREVRAHAGRGAVLRPADSARSDSIRRLHERLLAHFRANVARFRAEHAIEEIGNVSRHTHPDADLRGCGVQRAVARRT